LLTRSLTAEPALYYLKATSLRLFSSTRALHEFRGAFTDRVRELEDAFDGQDFQESIFTDSG